MRSSNSCPWGSRSYRSIQYRTNSDRTRYGKDHAGSSRLGALTRPSRWGAASRRRSLHRCSPCNCKRHRSRDQTARSRRSIGKSPRNRGRCRSLHRSRAHRVGPPTSGQNPELAGERCRTRMGQYPEPLHPRAPVRHPLQLTACNQPSRCSQCKRTAPRNRLRRRQTGHCSIANR